MCARPLAEYMVLIGWRQMVAMSPSSSTPCPICQARPQSMWFAAFSNKKQLIIKKYTQRWSVNSSGYSWVRPRVVGRSGKGTWFWTRLNFFSFNSILGLGPGRVLAQTPDSSTFLHHLSSSSSIAASWAESLDDATRPAWRHAENF